ncbi:FecR family protein [Pseudomonas sp. SH1-B]
MIEQQSTDEDERLSAEAAYWCARLHDVDCTAEERQAFARWIAADPSHQHEYDAMLVIWQLADQLRPTHAPMPRHAPIRPRRQRSPWRAARIATAAMLGAVTIWLGGWSAGLLPAQVGYYAAQDTPRKVILADGSHVQLNSHSRLIFATFRDRRSAWLKNGGEGYFEVTHNSEQPFSVLTGNGQVRVTGTRFNVWTDDLQMLVSLLEGAVVVSPPEGVQSGQAQLSPGMQARYRHGSNQIDVEQASTTSAIAWIEGKLVLDDLALSVALPLINRYLEQPVRLGDAASGNLRIGGIYRTDDLQALIESLPTVLPIEVKRHDDGGLVLKSRYAPL